MFDQLRRSVTERTESLRECRQCGTTVEEAAGRCPACDSTEIAHYEF
ncbi:hypothetical protein [Haloarcula amylovorans]|nr:hypothetical protein [Halomicroarcula amylolytica]